MSTVAVAVFMLVMDRCSHGCEICGRYLCGDRGYAWSIHHRRPGRMGGTKRADHGLTANLLAICGSGTTGCHGAVESNRAGALRRGHLLHDGDVPAHIPVALRYGVVYLDNAGDWSPDAPDGVAA